MSYSVESPISRFRFRFHLFTGLVLKSPIFKKLEQNELHKDDTYWETPEDHQHEN